VSQYPAHKLLDSQWDAVMLLIRRLGFDPNEFERGTTVGTAPPIKVIPQLVHPPTDSKLNFDYDVNRNSHGVAYTPGEQSPWDEAYLLDWPSVLFWVERWLKNVERERSTPNLWEMLEQSRELLAAYEETGDETNTPFSAEEQQQIAAQLNEIQALLVSQHGADPATLERGIEELKEASKRSGRREWLFLFLGVGLHWTLTGLIPPEGLRGILALAAQGIGHLFGGGLPQLPVA
jgi:hypothetical protein